MLCSFSQTVNWTVRPIEEALRPSEGVPISIFSGPQPVLQALVRYLHSQGMPFSEMARRLGRAESTLRSTLRAARNGPPLVVEPSIELPLAEFALGLSPLETVVNYLRGRGLRNVDVAALLGLDPRTTWTVQQRITRKGVAP